MNLIYFFKVENNTIGYFENKSFIRVYFAFGLMDISSPNFPTNSTIHCDFDLFIQRPDTLVQDLEYLRLIRFRI